MKKRHRGRDGRPRASHEDEGVDYGAEAARQRVAELLETFMHLEINTIVVGLPGGEREMARDRARSAAIVAGRLALFDESVAGARNLTLDTFSRGGFGRTSAVTDMAVAVLGGHDRVGAAAALEEAVIAEVVEDLVDSDTLEILRATTDGLLRRHDISSPASLPSLAAPRNDAMRTMADIVFLIAYLVFCLAIAITGGLGVGLVVLAVGAVVMAVVGRRRRPSET